MQELKQFGQDLKQFRSAQYASELFSRFEISGLWFWFLYMVCIGLGRLLLGYFYSKDENKEVKSAFWVKCFALGTLLSSLGVAYLFFSYFDQYNDVTR